MSKLKDIFVPGGQPTVTYVSRVSRAIESSLEKALDKGHMLISISGPTKSGKTVLCRKIVPADEAIWLHGGEYSNEKEFWDDLANKLELFSEEENAHSKASDSTTTGKLGVFGVGIDHAEKSQFSRTVRRRSTYTNKTAVLASLGKNSKIIIIDDFHYLDTSVQSAIVRALKSKIFEGLRVVVLAVPHRAYDAVRVENEMTGRVQQIRIQKWSPEELSEIARSGLAELNATMSDDLVSVLVDQAFGSPHLMQDFCYNASYEAGVKETSSSRKTISIADTDAFFQATSENTQKVAFNRLATGPRQRSDRLQRQFTNGEFGDIYIAVLKAVAATGPASRLTYEDIRPALKNILSEPPQAHEVTRVLQKMTEIAKELEGEPVLEWDEEEKALHLIDPFFSFYLRWGNIERPKV
jgi:hypothetical protein